MNKLQKTNRGQGWPAWKIVLVLALTSAWGLLMGQLIYNVGPLLIKQIWLIVALLIVSITVLVVLKFKTARKPAIRSTTSNKRRSKPAR